MTKIIQMSFNNDDFQSLSHTIHRWGESWKEQEGRFLPIPKYTWKYGYWFNNFLSMKVAQAYIGDESLWSCHVDECNDNCIYVLLTDFYVGIPFGEPKEA